MQDIYLRTDEQLDVLISLREVLHQVKRTINDPPCWKWAIIALVSATNGSLVCNLTGTMQLGALKKSHRKRMSDALQKATQSSGLASDLPDVYLETPMNLLDMAANQDRFDPGAGPRLPVSKDQRAAFKWILGLRNIFMHFQPQGLSIATCDLPLAFVHVVGIVKSAATDGHSFRHLSNEEREELARICALLERTLNEMEQRQAVPKEE